MTLTLGKSTLLGFRYKLVGFGYIPHPESSGKIQLTFFHQQSDKGIFLICMSDVSNKQAKLYRKALNQQIGKIVESDEVIPYVKRSIDGATLEQFKEVMRGSFEASYNMKVQW
tara:strand:+ start:362 stop:700 length:339 start_codon:yes stop_codon:yes gene_type:complete